ncbi:MAG: glycosyltransferase family 2 protein [Lachnospiraceae bacterium]|nr:glycosyltransferase family 2 protein [Lachnospiraceae bacterium]
MKVSIITAFYHGNDYMKQYTDCILANQKHMSKEDELEVILVNDSPDQEISLPIDGTDYNITIVDQKENGGIHSARVRGLKEAKGEYVMFLDQDDVLTENAVAKHVDKIKQWQQQISRMNEGNAVIQGTGLEQLMLHPVSVSNALLEQADGEQLLWYRTHYQKDKIGDYKTYLKVGIQIISPGQCLVPKKMIPVIWTTEICKVNGSDDYYLWLLLLSRRIPFLLLDEPLYIHKHTGNNLSANTDNTDASIYEFIEMLKQDTIISEKELKLLRRQISYKSEFRKGGIGTKLVSTLKNLDIFAANVIFKLRSKTPYGFNRS